MKKQLLSIHHFIVAVVLLTKGLDKILHHHSFIGWAILLLGLTVLICLIYVKLSKRPHALLELIIHLFESIALFLTTYVYFQEGKTFLPYITLIAGIGFLLATILHLKKHQKHST
jgi:FtsH-binding integral membrane protein